MTGPTRLQLQCLRALDKYFADNCIAPTIYELAAVLGWSESSVREKFKHLARHGLITRAPRRERYAVVTDAGRAALVSK